jgi:hypothetical protein
MRRWAVNKAAGGGGGYCVISVYVAFIVPSTAVVLNAT